MTTRGPEALPVATRPTYRLDRSFEWNHEHGPDFAGPWPDVPAAPAKSFLGFPVGSRFGVPASILQNSRWIALYARLGFDLLTYKTVRSVARTCGTPPNWVPLDVAGLPAALAERDGAARVAGDTAAQRADTTYGGSFGMPSRDPEEWRADIGRARAAIGPAQVLIVSVVGTARSDTSEEAFIADFAQCARWAAQGGAQIIEANLSCPNVGKAEGELFLDVAMAGRISRAVKDAVADRPLLLKLGAMDSPERLAAFCAAVAGAADGLVLVNAPARRIVDRDDRPFFGAGRERAGVTGAAIKPHALAAVRDAVATIDRLRLRLAVVGCGGIVSAADAREFIDAGACAALSCTGATFDPYLAARVKQAAPEV